MAPMKRQFDDAFDFTSDPVFELNLVSLPGTRPAKRSKDTHDLSTYLTASDDEFDAMAPAEVLEFSILPESLVTSPLMDVPTYTSGTPAAKNPFLGRGASIKPDAIAPVAPAFHEITSDFSSDDDTYASMFNTPVYGSPAHVLNTEYDIPYIDDISVAEAAEDMLAAVNPTSARLTAAVETLKPLAAEPALAPGVAKPPPSQPVDPTARAMTKDGKPVNPTRWAHNSTERKRRLEIRKLFSGLRDLFHDIAGDDKISNITTLNRAIDHVAELKKSIDEREAAISAMRERNALLKVRAQAALAARSTQADVPPEAAVVLEGTADPELRKTLPAALRQLLDHNSRGAVEQKPLSRRRKMANATQLVTVAM